MLQSKHHFFIYPFFQFYTLRIMKKHFQKVSIEGRFIDDSKPVLLIGNHIGWWDGFWAMYLKIKVLKRKFYVMMQEDQLLRFRFFNNTGAFSINRKSKDIIESLRYASKIIRDPQNMVVMYPQGQLQSLYSTHFHFERGIEYILKGREGEVQLLMTVNMIDYLSHRKPSLSIYLREYQGPFLVKSLEESYNSFYSDCLTTQTKRTE